MLTIILWHVLSQCCQHCITDFELSLKKNLNIIIITSIMVNCCSLCIVLHIYDHIVSCYFIILCCTRKQIKCVFLYMPILLLSHKKVYLLQNAPFVYCVYLMYNAYENEISLIIINVALVKVSMLYHTCLICSSVRRLRPWRNYFCINSYLFTLFLNVFWNSVSGWGHCSSFGMSFQANSRMATFYLSSTFVLVEQKISN